MSEVGSQPEAHVNQSRRLVPQFSLTKQDLGADHAVRHKSETPKKPVIRFTREQLILLRKESAMLPSMNRFPEIVSIESLSPVCLQRLEPEDVSKLYSMAAKEGHGRGRARGLKFNKADDYVEESKKSGDSLWDDDDAGAADTFDLADFAKAALKFRSDTEDMKGRLLNDNELCTDDAIGALVQEQTASPDMKEDAIPPSNDAPLSSLLLESTTLTEKTPEFPSAAIESIPSLTQSDNLFTARLHFGGFDLFSVPEKKELVVEWFYRDPQGDVQGPFGQENMRLWNKEGYFSPELPIRLSTWSKFHLFSEVFSNASFAFVDVPSEPASINFAFELPKSRISNEVVTVSSNESHTSSEQVKVDEPALAATENCKQEQVVSHNIEKSDFAKKLLGIGQRVVPKSKEVKPAVVVASPVRKDVVIDSPPPVEVVTKPTPMLTRIINSESEEAKTVKGWNNNVSTKPVVKLTDIQQQQQREDTKPSPAVSSTSSVSPGLMSIQLKSLLGVRIAEDSKAKPAWSSSVPVDAPVSINDIMNEELNKKQSSSVGAVAVAVAVAVAAPVSVHAKAAPSNNTWASKAMGNQIASAGPVELPPKKAAVVPSAKPVTHEPKPSAAIPVSNSTKSDFGGKAMSKELSDWCSTQLTKIKGNDDAIGLMEFCMSLQSPAEIRSYLSEYLGSSAQITNFATDFIKLKDGNKKHLLSVDKIQEIKAGAVPSQKKKGSGR